MTCYFSLMAISKENGEMTQNWVVRRLTTQTPGANPIKHFITELRCILGVNTTSKIYFQQFTTILREIYVKNIAETCIKGLVLRKLVKFALNFYLLKSL